MWSLLTGGSMATKNNSNANKKKKGSILPLIVVLILGFLAYKANPEYWQQGRLFQDLKNGGQKKVETEEIANIPKEPQEPKIDPNEIREGSIKGSKTVPKYVLKAVNTKDPNYYMFRSKYKTIYLVTAESSSSKKLSSDISEAIQKQGLKDEFRFDSLLYAQSTKKAECERTTTLQFFCEQCDRKICIVNPEKKEFITVAPSLQGAIGKAKALQKSGW